LTGQIQNECYETQKILVIPNSNKAMIIFYVFAHDSLMLSVKSYHHQVLVCTVFKQLANIRAGNMKVHHRNAPRKHK